MTPVLTIRLSAESDALALGRLARLDSTLYDGSSALLAEADGRLLAAITLECGAAFSDPFERSAEAVALLALRREQLTRDPNGARRVGRLRGRRRAPASV